MQLLNIAILTPIILTSFIARKLEGNWYGPGAFFSLYWTLLCLIPIIFAPNEYVSPLAIAYITLTAVLVVLGSEAGKFISMKRLSITRNATMISVVRIKLLLVVTTISGLGFIPAVLWAEGYTIFGLFEGDGFENAVSHFVNGRYSETLVEPWYSRPLLVCTYLSPLLGGTLLSLNRSHVGSKWLSFTSLAPAFFIMLIRSEKWPFAVAVALFYSTYSAHQFSMAKRSEKFNIYKSIRYVLLVLLMLFVFSISQYIRIMGNQNEDFQSTVYNKMYSNALSHLTVFSYWFDKNYLVIDPSFGVYTFPGLYDLIGIHTRKPGLYDDFVMLYNGETSNLHTFFRPMVQDFTTPFSLIIFFVIGIFFRCVFLSINVLSSFVTYAFFITMILLSFNMNILGSNSVMISFLFFYLVNKSIALDK